MIRFPPAAVPADAVLPAFKIIAEVEVLVVAIFCEMVKLSLSVSI